MGCSVVAIGRTAVGFIINRRKGEQVAQTLVDGELRIVGRVAA